MIPKLEFIYSHIYDGAFITVKYKKWPAYKRSWEIVEEEGYETILKELKKLTK